MATTQTLSDLTIRPMQLEDIEAVAQIENSVYLAPWPKLAFYASLEKQYPAFILQKNEEIIGYVIISLVHDEAHILNFAIAKTWQHQGLGRYLLEFLLSTLAQRKVVRLSLEVSLQNIPAIHLYESLGFQRRGVRKQYYPSAQGYIDALILVRESDYN